MSRWSNRIQIVLIGDSGVGKTAIARRYTKDVFEVSITTIGVCPDIFNVSYQGLEYNAVIWDTAGQERFRSMVPSFYRNAQIICVVYDVTDDESTVVGQMTHWVQELAMHHPGIEQVPIFVVGNKSDLDLRLINPDQVIEPMVQQWNENPNLTVYTKLVSAATGRGINNLFDNMFEVFFTKFCPVPIRYQVGSEPDEFVLDSRQKKRSGCC